MSFSRSAATSFVPLLSRVVLCAAFVSAGYNKVFTDAEFTADEADKLQQMGITTSATVNHTAASGVSQTQAGFVLASYRQVEPADDPMLINDLDQVEPATTQPDEEEPDQEEPEQEEPAPADPTPPATTSPAEPPAAPPTTAPAKRRPAIVTPRRSPAQPPATATAPAEPPNVVITPREKTPAVTAPVAPLTLSGTYTARSMYTIALMVNADGWPMPKWMARIAAFTELIGGGLILVGLFSRLWGLGLAGVMAVAFYFTSLGTLDKNGWMINELTIPEFNTLFSQLGLFVLAFGILLTGAGRVSLDRLIFGNRWDGMAQDNPL